MIVGGGWRRLLVVVVGGWDWWVVRGCDGLWWGMNTKHDICPKTSWGLPLLPCQSGSLGQLASCFDAYLWSVMCFDTFVVFRAADALVPTASHRDDVPLSKHICCETTNQSLAKQSFTISRANCNQVASRCLVSTFAM